jgi:hypothetical protein
MKKIGFKELYLEYPDKTYDVTSSTVPCPYFPKDQLTDNKYSLTYGEWKKIVVCYFKYVLQYLLTGKPFNIPGRLGIFQLKKYKPKRKPVDWKRTNEKYGEWNAENKEKKFVYHTNRHTQGYQPLIKWYRSECKFPFQWHWRFKWSDGVRKYISKEIDKDITIINKWNDA